jgi:GEVED domain/Secretion system C-terminal sorting domain
MNTRHLLFSFMALFGIAISANSQISYCSPTFSNGCFSWNTKEVTVGTISWALGFDDCSISDYTSQQTDLAKGEPHPMTVVNGAWCGTGVWVDLNQDGTFDDSENLYYMYEASELQTYSFDITIPSTTENGLYRMRVVTGWGSDCFNVSDNGYGACGSYQYGSFQDFTINVTTAIGVAENADLNSTALKMSPNPVNESSILTVTGINNGGAYAIMDQMGRQVLTGRLTSGQSILNLEHLATGVYIINIIGKDNISLRFIKN